MMISERIKLEGAKHDMTLASIERELGLGNGTIRRWDSSTPSVDKLYKVANLLNVSLDYLYTGDEKSIILSNSQREWLALFNELPVSERAECIGFIRGYIAHDNLHGDTYEERQRKASGN